MAVRKLDDNHDWTFGQGVRNYLINSDEVKQSVLCRLWSFKNDWALDMDAGLPWFELMGRNIDMKQIEQNVRACVLETAGVTEITSYNATLNRETRKLTIAVSFKDIYENENNVIYQNEAI